MRNGGQGGDDRDVGGNGRWRFERPAARKIDLCADERASKKFFRANCMMYHLYAIFRKHPLSTYALRGRGVSKK